MFEFSRRFLRAPIWRATIASTYASVASSFLKKLRQVGHNLSYQRCGNCLSFLVSMWSERQGSVIKAGRQKEGESHENFHGCSCIGSVHCACGDVCPNPHAWRTRV